MRYEYIGFDLETTVRNQKGHSEILLGNDPFPGHPYHPENRVVVSGFYSSDGYEELWDKPHDVQGRMITGHNLSFDLAYVLRYYDHQQLVGLMIWDTQLAHFMLQGQTVVQPSLNEVAEYYDLPLKKDLVKAYWDEGYDTDKIPQGILSEYLQHDCYLAYEICKLQRKEAAEKGLLELIEWRNQSILMTVLMTHNGLWADVQKYMEVSKEFAAKRDKLKQELEQYMDDTVYRVLREKYDTGVHPNLNSSKQLKAFLFGGELYKYKAPVPSRDKEGRLQYYKGGDRKGQLKTKLQQFPMKYAGILGANEKCTETDVLVKYKHHEFVEKLLYYRSINKEITMLESYGKFMLTNGDGYAIVHPQFNHTIAATGRLTSSNPNVQNLSNKEVD